MIHRQIRIRLLILSVPLAMTVGCGPPQIGGDREVFQAVDALYTAVSLRDPALLERCGGRLKELGASGKLPAPASASLESIVAEAESSGWESSQARLARFMEGQRR